MILQTVLILHTEWLLCTFKFTHLCFCPTYSCSLHYTKQPLPRLVAEGAKQEELMASATRRRQQRLAKRRAAAAKEPTSLPATDYRRTISVPDTSVIRSESRADPLSRMKISPDRTLSHLVQVVMPQHVNPGGVTFGGQARPATSPC